MPKICMSHHLIGSLIIEWERSSVKKQLSGFILCIELMFKEKTLTRITPSRVKLFRVVINFD